MSRYRRNREGQVYFFTVVTHARRPILTSDLGRHCLRTAIRQVQKESPLENVGMVLLPDHLHAICELPQGEQDYSVRWKKIKSTFTMMWRKSGGGTLQRSASRIKRGEHAVWQRRFFEHTCRDELDLKRCLDYLHVNPLKHGLVQRVVDWPWSTFHRFVAAGEYSPDWGNADEWHGDEFATFE
ncbi:MAG: transposase [Planctomycetaceae bacterium]